MHELNPDRGSGQVDYVSRLRELTREITGAISALERNDLSEFLRCLANQEAIAVEVEAELKSVLSDSGVTRRGTDGGSAAGKDLHSACVQLAHANRIFAAVVKRSMRSTSLLAALYQSSAGTYGRTSGPLAEHRTISCEV